ncbi:hypothetical protein Pfo_008040 [Paulownia fortunei]|nr:hypothetical protein Pfo_008040 [Paulownia fortunei]
MDPNLVPHQLFKPEYSGDIPNSDYSLWVRQGQLVLSAIAGSISPNLIPFISSTRISHEAWNIFASTYAKPSRMQRPKVIADELAMINHPIDSDDITLKILGGLDDKYNDFRSTMHVCENPVTFDELHEKLINFDAHLKFETQKNANLLNMPTFANTAQKSFHNWSPTTSNCPSNHKNRTPSFTNTLSFSFQPPHPSNPCPYLDKCQLCSQNGHSAKRYPLFKYIPCLKIPNPKPTTTLPTLPKLIFQVLVPT